MKERKRRKRIGGVKRKDEKTESRKLRKEGKRETRGRVGKTEGRE